MEASINQKSATISMTRSEALVLFEVLARFEQTEKLHTEDPAEELTLWRTLAALEKVLVEPFAPDYMEMLSAARQAVRSST